MPIGGFEKEVLTLLAAHRNPESYIGGATVLNQSPQSPRRSEDIDVFHDSEAALIDALDQDIPLLKERGYRVRDLFRTPSLYRAVVEKGGRATRLEWVTDSSFRFFPIEPDPELGYRLHFWDAATNKVLAGVGRREIRDYVDLLEIHQHRLSLGALIWAAAGKDPGLNPHSIRQELARTHRYAPPEYETLNMEPVNPEEMRSRWCKGLQEADELFEHVLADAPVGCLFLDQDLRPQTPDRETIFRLRPHFGSVGGCWPRVVDGGS